MPGICNDAAFNIGADFAHDFGLLCSEGHPECIKDRKHRHRRCNNSTSSCQFRLDEFSERTGVTQTRPFVLQTTSDVRAASVSHATTPSSVHAGWQSERLSGAASPNQT